MKSLKKIGILLFAVCFLMLYPSVSVHAAEGTFQFSDPTAKVGEDVTVKAKISTGGEAIGDGFVTVTYESSTGVCQRNQCNRWGRNSEAGSYRGWNCFRAGVYHGL